MMKNLSVLLSLLFLIGCKEVSNDQPKNELLGVWEMKSILWITKDTTYTISEAQPGKFIFTPTNYSLMWTPTEEPRIPFRELSNPTNEETIAGFRSIVFNTGTYDYTDSTIVSRAQIAKVPGFEGGQQFYRYNINGDTLSLTMYDETYPNGEKPNWFGRYVTKFILVKIE